MDMLDNIKFKFQQNNFVKRNVMPSDLIAFFGSYVATSIWNSSQAFSPPPPRVVVVVEEGIREVVMEEVFFFPFFRGRGEGGKQW